MKLAPCIVRVAFILASLTGTAASAETLYSVVRRTLETNPELKALRYNRAAIDQELQAAKGLGLPSVDARAGAGHRATDQSAGARGTLTGQGYRSRNRGEAGISVTQKLFDGGDYRNQVERQGNRVQSARHRVLDTSNAVALQAVQAHLEVLRAGSVRGVAQRNVQRHAELLERVRARVSGGRSPAVEVNQAVARLQAARAAQAETDGRYKDALALFNAVVGTPPGKLALPAPPVKSLPKSVETAVTQARRGAPSIIARMFDAAAAENAIGAARSEFYPKINLEAGADYTYDVDRKNGRRTDIYGMLVVRQNLYRGGIDTARMREAEARALEAYELSGVAHRSVEREVRLSWHAIHTAQTRAAAIERQLANNRTVVSAYAEQFDLGQRTLLDILDIQNEIFINESALATEQFVANYNVYRVIAAMGRLVAALGLTQPAEALRLPDMTGTNPLLKSAL